MFDTLSTKLLEVFETLKKRGKLSEANVESALREIRVALLGADVALPVVTDFIDVVRKRAVGEEGIRSVTPGQMGVKIVNDHLTEMLGSESVEINLASIPPVAIMMVGLQGSGKTTTTAKVADYLRKRFRKRTIMASQDVRRPAAQKQLEVLGKESEIDTLQIVPFESP